MRIVFTDKRHCLSGLVADLGGWELMADHRDEIHKHPAIEVTRLTVDFQTADGGLMLMLVMLVMSLQG